MGSIETVKKMYELFATRNLEAIREIFDPNIAWNMMKGFPQGGQYNGVEEVFKNLFSGFITDWKEWKAVSTRFVDTEEVVFVIGYYEGIYIATNKYVKVDFIIEYKIKDEKITEYNQYTDTLLIWQAMV